jgi:hypothetical protein
MDFISGLILIGLIVGGALWLNSRSKKRPATSKPVAARKAATDKQEGLTFMIEGKDPEVDSVGRVIVRLGAGSQHELGVKSWSLDFEDACYLLGKPKSDDEIAKTVRIRIIRTETRGQTIFKVVTPKGAEIGEISYKDVDSAALVFGTLETFLNSYDQKLVGKEFVFDVALKVEGSWMRDEDEEIGWEDSIDDLYIRVKDPADIEIRSA